MKSLPSEDPFEHTRMSFGEHLEELRSALWKAIVSLFLGFLVGLLLGDDLIRLVQTPLQEGLEQLELEKKQQRFEDAREQGDAGDTDLAAEGLAPEQHWVNPLAIIELLEGLGVAVEAPAEGMPDRMPLTLWRAPERAGAVATGVQTSFSVYIKASLVVGVVLSSPFVFYFLWSFVAAGLYPHEKKYVHYFLPVSVGLFLLGAVVAFFLVLHYVVAFLFGFNAWLDIDALPRIDEWLGFVLILPIGFGVAFQLPLVMLFLERIGVVQADFYLRYWKYAVLIIFILSMILTPADPQSMLIMAGLLTPLYFGGVAICKWLPRGGKEKEMRG